MEVLSKRRMEKEKVILKAGIGARLTLLFAITAKEVSLIMIPEVVFP